MTALERNAYPKVGAEFFREHGVVMFHFVIDPGNIVGPRPATKVDSEKHPHAWTEFMAGDAIPQAAEIEAEINTPPADGVFVVADDESEHPTLAEAAEHVKTKRAYTKRQVA